MTQNEASTVSQINTKLPRGCSLAVHARSLRRIRPTLDDLGKHRAVSKLIEQCKSWENGGNKTALRRDMEKTMQSIEGATLWQGE
jgi:hypothetical protein